MTSLDKSGGAIAGEITRSTDQDHASRGDVSLGIRFVMRLRVSLAAFFLRVWIVEDPAV